MKTKKISILFHLLLIITIIFIAICSSLQASNVKNSAVILMYHKFNISKHPSTNIKLEQFERHLNELSKSKYNVLSLDYIVDTIINDGILPQNTVGITVDDADRSFLEIAWPRLKALGLPVTLFVTSNTISPYNKNYLNWDEIRRLQNEGVTIGAHSHSHSHLATLKVEDLKNEIEKSNRVFLKELGKMPNLFAYPYGETNGIIMNLLKDYKFKVAFGQHSGVMNETSDMYYLPRFSLNEKYGNIERIQFILNTKGMGVYDFVPIDPTIIDNPPYIGFSLLDEKLSNKINCYIFDNKGQIENDLFKFNERIEIRLKRKMANGRSRLNCTSRDSNNKWRWFGHQFYIRDN